MPSYKFPFILRNIIFWWVTKVNLAMLFKRYIEILIHVLWDILFEHQIELLSYTFESRSYFYNWISTIWAFSFVFLIIYVPTTITRYESFTLTTVEFLSVFCANFYTSRTYLTRQCIARGVFVFNFFISCTTRVTIYYTILFFHWLSQCDCPLLLILINFFTCSFITMIWF